MRIFESCLRKRAVNSRFMFSVGPLVGGDLKTVLQEPLHFLPNKNGRFSNAFKKQTSHFQRCFNSLQAHVTEECAPMDRDGDEEVDLDDFAAFQSALNDSPGQ